MSLPNIKVKYKNDHFYLFLDYYHDEVVNFIKDIDGSDYDREKFGKEHVWNVPAEEKFVQKLELLNTSYQFADDKTEIEWNNIDDKSSGGLSHNLEGVDISDYEPKLDFWDHQEHAFKLARRLDDIALLFDMGTGKTKTSIDIACDRFQRNELGSVLVMAPLSVLPVWPKEFKKHATVEYDIIDLHCNNNTKRRDQNIDLFSRYVDNENVLTVGLITYDTAWRIDTQLREMGPESIIADESTEIKTPSAKRTKGAHRLARSDSVDYRMILTGTAITNSPLDAWSQYEFLDPSIFNKNYFQFKNTYAVLGGYGGKEVLSYQNLDDLKQKIHSVSVRVTKDECLDLPPKVFEERYVQLSKQERKHYDDLKEKSITRLNERDEVTVNNILAELAKLQQVAGGFLNVPEIDYIEEEVNTKVERFGKAKLNELETILSDLGDEKSVVWARFREDINAIENLINDKFNFECVSIHGGTSDKSGKLIEKFNNDEDTQVLIAQIQTCARGVDFTTANYAIYYSNTFSVDLWLQSQDRHHREGQNDKVTYIKLLSENTVDERIYRSLEDNADLANEIMNEYRSGDLYEGI